MGSKIVRGRALLLLLLALMQTPAFAKYANSKIEKNLKTEISNQQENISKIKSEIMEVESLLSQANKRFVSIESKKSKLDARIYQAKLDLSKMKEKVSGQLDGTKKLFNSLVVNSLGDKKNLKGLLRGKMLKKAAKQKIILLNKQLASIKKLEDNIKQQQVSLNENYQLANEISDLLIQMENKKKLLANKYVLEVQSKEKMEGKYKQLLKKNTANKKKSKNKIAMQFTAPIEKYTGLDYDKKGVTYKFHGDHNVLSTQGGKVIYSGPLSTYGNVVMIDHGNDTRSVLLGKFKSTVEKGASVKRGQVIGKANAQVNGKNSIYFEVRHKQKVQNTIDLIEKEKISRNNTVVKQIRFEGT